MSITYGRWPHLRHFHKGRNQDVTKRLQIMIEEKLGGGTGRALRRGGRVEGGTHPRVRAQRLKPLPSLDKNPLCSMVGADEFEPAPVDDVVYR